MKLEPVNYIVHHYGRTYRYARDNSLSVRFLRWTRRVRERVETAVAWLFVLAVAALAVALWAWLLLAEG